MSRAVIRHQAIGDGHQIAPEDPILHSQPNAARCRLDRPYRPIPAYPGTVRDLAIVVDERVSWADINDCIRRSAPPALESVELFDIYRGKPVPAGRKSVAISFTFRRSDRTITAAEAEEARSSILAALTRDLGAILR